MVGGSARACSSGEWPVEHFIRRGNIALYKKYLAEPHTDEERKVVLKLLADKEAQDPPPLPRKS
jgi:hypothetical protein